MKKLTWLIGSIVTISSLTTAACGDDEDTPGSGATAGTAGTSGKGGVGGKGGSAGKGGSGGNGGDGGSAGSMAGTGTGGTGTGGTGTGGTGTGGTGTGGTGVSGSAGESGMSGEGGDLGMAGSDAGGGGMDGGGSGGEGGTNGGTGGTGTGGGGTGGAGTGGAGTGGAGTGGAGTGGGGTGGGGTGGGGTGGGGTGGAGTGGGGTGGAAALTCEQLPSQELGDGSFTVTVTGFDNCDRIPTAHTCEGKPFPEGTSPAISWTAGPTGTMSYALVFKDLSILARVDPSSNMAYNRGFHYVIWDIPADVTSLPAELSEGHLPEDVEGARQWSNFNNYGYFGPCPNFDPAQPRSQNDSYAFTLYALPTAVAEIALPTPGISTVRQLDNLFKAEALAIAEYRGTSDAWSIEIPPGTLPPMTNPPCPNDGSTPPANCLQGPSTP